MEQVDGNYLKGEEALTHRKLKEMLQCVIDGYKWRHYGTYNVVNFWRIHQSTCHATRNQTLPPGSSFTIVILLQSIFIS